MLGRGRLLQHVGLKPCVVKLYARQRAGGESRYCSVPAPSNLRVILIRIATIPARRGNINIPSAGPAAPIDASGVWNVRTEFASRKAPSRSTPARETQHAE